MKHAFDTDHPVELYVELGAGDAHVAATETTETVVEVTGKNAEDVVVEQRGHSVSVVAPRRTGFLGNDQSVSVRVTVPTDSDLVAKLGSADLGATGRLLRVRLTTGSGDVRLGEVAGEAFVKAGSGDITIRGLGGSSQLKTGSGDIAVQHAEGPAAISTGSGDVSVARAGADVSIKSGSGNLHLGDAAADAELSTASGAVTVDRYPAGRLTVSNVSGDIRVRIPDGVPVWTDVSSTTGRVSSTLTSAGTPQDGQPYVELRARTVTGDVLLQHTASQTEGTPR